MFILARHLLDVHCLSQKKNTCSHIVNRVVVVTAHWFMSDGLNEHSFSMSLDSSAAHNGWMTLTIAIFSFSRSPSFTISCEQPNGVMEDISKLKTFPKNILGWLQRVYFWTHCSKLYTKSRNRCFESPNKFCSGQQNVGSFIRWWETLAYTQLFNFYIRHHFVPGIFQQSTFL